MSGSGASWGDFERAAPALAASGRRVLGGSDGNPIGFLATVARDGRPRIAPVCPIFCGAELYLSVGIGTPKRYDLANDGRYALHAFLGENDEEFQISGRARAVDDADERSRVHAAISFAFQPDDPVFRLAVERCLWGYWENVGQPDTRAVRERWSAV